MINKNRIQKIAGECFDLAVKRPKMTCDILLYFDKQMKTHLKAQQLEKSTDENNVDINRWWGL